MHYATKKASNRAFHKAILYGDSKTGKTLELVKLAEFFKIYLFDLEEGSDVIALIPEEWWDNIVIIPVRDQANQPNAMETMFYFFEQQKGYVCWEHGRWKCPRCMRTDEVTEVDFNKIEKDAIVGIDSVSQLTSSCINAIANKDRIDMVAGDKFEFDQWGKLSNIMGRIFTGVQSAPFHVCAISHETNLEEEGSKHKKFNPVGGSKNFSRQLPKYFGHVIHHQNYGGKLRQQSSVSDAKTFVAGNRANLDFSKGDTLLDVFQGKIKPIDWEAKEAEADKKKILSPTKKPLSATTSNTKSLFAKKKLGEDKSE